MTLLGGLFTPRAASLENPQVPISSSSILDFLGIKPTAAGVTVNEKTALAMPAVWQSVNIIAGTCAGLPLHAFKKGDESRTVLTKGAAAELLDNPHPDLVAYDFWEIVYGHRALWGNAVCLKLRDKNGVIRELWPVHPSRVKFGRESTTGQKVYAIDGGEDAGGLTYVGDKDILHLPGFGYDGISGLSPIQMARQGIGLALAAEEFGAKLFGSGSLASGILQTDQRLRPEQADALAARWRKKSAGIVGAHEVIVLDAGSKFTQLTIPPEDAQFLESRNFQVREIARMFGVPPHLLMDVEGSTSWGTGIEEQTLGFVVFNLRRWLTRTEQALTRMLAPGTVMAKYSLNGLLQGAPEKRAEFYTKMWNLGALSTNDIRRLEDMAPVEGGDQRYIALNFGPLGALPNSGGDEPAETDADRAMKLATIAQKAYLAVDGNKIFTAEEGRELLNAAGAGLDPADPFEVEEPAAPAELPADPAAPVVPDEEGVTA